MRQYHPVSDVKCCGATRWLCPHRPYASTVPSSQAIDSSTATILGAAVGAVAALIATFVTLAVTRWLDDRRWVREREHREVVERRAAYAKMRRTLIVWREATVDLIGKPKKADWEKYWAARHDAMEAGADLELIGSALAIDSVGEALEELLDVWWDYENNGPWAVESGPLWSRMRYIDARLDAFRDLARAEFDLEPASDDPRRWLEPPELVRQRAEELRQRSQRQSTPRRESDVDARSRLDYEERMHRARRSGTVRRLELSNHRTETDANRLVDAWEAEAAAQGISREAADYWQRGDEWIRRQPDSESGAPSE